VVATLKLGVSGVAAVPGAILALEKGSSERSISLSNSAMPAIGGVDLRQVQPDQGSMVIAYSRTKSQARSVAEQ
jgi:hypothetical protein